MTIMRPSRWAALLLMAAMLQHHVAASTEPAPDTASQEEQAESEGAEARFNASLETWLYSTRIWLTGHNVLNTGNRLARRPETQSLLDTRVNITAEYGPLNILIQPRIVAQKDDAGPQTDPQIRRQVSTFDKSAELTQANARLKLGDHTVVLGRELMTWGPGNFRSPSNPFYDDSGRTSPLAATPGIDVLRYTYNMGSTRVHAARVFATDQIRPSIDMRDSRLLKVDYQGENYLLSVNAVQRPGYADFFGGFAQFSPNDAWMLFGEFGTKKPVSGKSSVVGAAYTLESGHVLTAEWMHNSGGLTRGEQAAFFRQIEQARTISDALVGATLSQAPQLLGRDYLWLSVQSNPQDTKQYWRAEWSQSMTDNSGSAMLYAEKSLMSRLSAFMALSATTGGAKSDFGAFTKGTLTIGVKLFVF
jgi:hypothetical protein